MSTARRLSSLEIAGVDGDALPAKDIHHPVECVGRHPLEHRFTRPRPALGVDDISTFLLPAVDQQGNDLGRILKVCVDDDYGVAAAVIQPGRHGDFLAEIPAEVDEANRRVVFPQRVQQIHRSIAAAVVDVDDFARIAQPRPYGGKAPVELEHDVGFVIDQHDD